jgi:hypothetical protein
MNTPNNKGFQGDGSPLQGCSDPNSNNNTNNNSNNPINSSPLIPGTYMPNGNPNDVYQLYTPPSNDRRRPAQPMLCRVITGGNDGPLYVSPNNPLIAYNSENFVGFICTSCGKGILLCDMDMLRNENEQRILFFGVLCPCICCYLYSKKKKCSSCKAEYPNTCW